MTEGKVARLKFHHQGPESGCSNDFSASPPGGTFFFLLSRYWPSISRLYISKIIFHRSRLVTNFISCVRDSRVPISLDPLSAGFMCRPFMRALVARKASTVKTRVECAVYSRFMRTPYGSVQTIQYRST